MGRRNKRSKKKARAGGVDESEALTKAPHSFVIKRGKLGKYVNELMLNMRQVLEPFTAINLKVKKKNVVRDFVSVASMLNVTHLLVFTRTDNSPYLRVMRLPKGPTLTYKIVNYTLSRDVRSNLRKPLVHSGLFQCSPLLVLNSFSAEEELQMKLTTSMWRNLFPSIDVNTINLNTIKRCVLLNYNPDTHLIDLRHYALKVKPVGISRSIRKLLTGKRVPDLGQFNDLQEALSKDATFTESEGEADEKDESRQVTLPQEISTRGNIVNEKSAIRLYELGPRMTLELVKIEEGLMGGDVLFHSFIKKSKAEVRKQKAVRIQKAHAKLSRKRQQEENVRRKKGIAAGENQNEEDNEQIEGEEVEMKEANDAG